MARVIPGNGQVVTTVVYEPDRWGVQASSIGIMTNTFSPAASGPKFTGLPGFGVLRATAFPRHGLQNFRGAVDPILNPANVRLGIGSGVSGAAALPYTGGVTGGAPAALAWLSYNPAGQNLGV